MPQEYVEILRESMLNKCPVSSYEQVCEVVKSELGELPDKVCCICLSSNYHGDRWIFAAFTIYILHLTALVKTYFNILGLFLFPLCV